MAFLRLWQRKRCWKNQQFFLRKEAEFMDFIKRTWAEVDLDALDYNIKSIKSKMAPKHKVMGIVKADAYGHGDGFVARKLQA